MRSSIPPRIATWLFNRLGPRNEELAGDLIEEYKSGRSAAWYWWQVLIAIVVGLRTEFSNHKLLAAKAVVTSWTILYLAWHLIPGIPPNLVRFIGNGYTLLELFEWILPLEIFVISVASAWIFGWTNRRFHRSALLILLISFVLSFGYLNFSYIGMLVVDSIDQPRFRPYLGYVLLRLVAGIAGAVIGGLWSSPARTSLPRSSGPLQTD